MPGTVLHEMQRLWIARERSDEFFGTLVNAYLAAGGQAWGVKAGEDYVDVGTFNGYRAAIGLLNRTGGSPAGWSGSPQTSPAPPRPIHETLHGRP